jgi:hypothetical protein
LQVRAAGSALRPAVYSLLPEKRAEGSNPTPAGAHRFQGAAGVLPG